MIKPIPALSVEVVPQAVIRRPIRDVIGGRAELERGADGLDYFEGASFKFASFNEGNLEIAVRHYRGYPKNTATIYIDQRVQEVEVITSLVREILGEFGLTEEALEWERAQNPSL